MLKLNNRSEVLVFTASAIFIIIVICELGYGNFLLLCFCIRIIKKLLFQPFFENSLVDGFFLTFHSMEIFLQRFT